MQTGFLKTLLLLTLAVLSQASAQTESTTVFFPGGLAFQPLLANHEEPRMGAYQDVGERGLTVGIGNAVDVVEKIWPGDTLRAGLEFFAYALATTFGQYQLKIDAADGFFGFHVALLHGRRWQVRVRGLHQSAHLVDGRFDTDTHVWLTDKNPFPFSRNYLEATLAYRLLEITPYSRAYAGTGVSLYNNPRDIRTLLAHAGIELVTGSSPFLYAAYHGSLMGVPSYVLTHTVECGIKFGSWNGRGIRLSLSYTSGLNWYGEYYNQRKTMWALGALVDFW